MIRTYQLAFRDTDGELVTILDITGALQVRMRQELNTFGAIQATIPIDALEDIHTTLDAACQLYVSYDEADPMTLLGTFFLRDYVFLQDENFQELAIISGYGLEHLYFRRIFLAEDDPLVANGYCTKSGYADVVMSEIVEEQCIDPNVNTARAITGLALGTISSVGDSVAFREQSSTAKVIEHLQKLSRAGLTDFWIDYSESGPAYTAQFGIRGTDKRKVTHAPTSAYIYFAPQLGTMETPTLSVLRKEEGNHVYVFGQGPGGARLIYDVEGDGVTDSPWNDCEFGVEARHTDVLDDWLTEASSALNLEKAKLVAFTFSPKHTPRGAVYGQDYVLGDLVTAGYQGREFDMRVKAVQIDLSGDGELITPELELYTE